MSEELQEKQSIEETTQKVVKKDEKVVSENNRRHFKYRGTTCLNCTQPLDLSDRYCPYCSQLNSTKPLSLKDFFLEFLSSLVSYDSRLRFTVKDLLFKPGTITRNYIGGQRLKYSNPFRFFLSVSIIYFLVYSIVGFFNPSAKTPFLNFNNNNGKESSDKNERPNFFYQNNTDEEIEKAIETLDANPATKIWAKKLRKEDSIRRLTIKREENNFRIENGDTIKNNDFSGRVKSLEKKNGIEKFFQKFELLRDFYKDSEIKSAAKALDSLKLERSKTNIWIYNKNFSIDRVEEDPVSFGKFIISKTPFFLFFFAPIFALFFWLLYLRRPFSYMEHLVFIFHIFSFVFLCLLLLSIPDILFDTQLFIGILFGILGPFYFYKALRNFYKQSRLKTILKFVLLNIIFFISATTVAILFFAATAATY